MFKITFDRKFMTVYNLDLPAVPLDVTLTKDMLIDCTWPAHSSILWFTFCPGHWVSVTTRLKLEQHKLIFLHL